MDIVELTGRQADRKDRHIVRETDRQADEQTDSQSLSRSEMQTDRQRDRHADNTCIITKLQTLQLTPPG